MGMSLAFWILAVASVGGALAVVLLRDVFRAALFLVLSFFAIAGLYITLNADFLAAVQVLIYVGAIAVLLIFALMLTREAPKGSPPGRLRLPALVIGLLLLVALVLTVVNTPWQLAKEAPAADTTSKIALALFSTQGFVLPFEIASLLLLAAVIGAIVLVKDK